MMKGLIWGTYVLICVLLLTLVDNTCAIAFQEKAQNEYRVLGRRLEEASNLISKVNPGNKITRSLEKNVYSNVKLTLQTEQQLQDSIKQRMEYFEQVYVSSNDVADSNVSSSSSSSRNGEDIGSDQRRKRSARKFEDITDQVTINKGELPLENIIALQVVIEWVGKDETDDAILVIAHENENHPGALFRSTNNGKTFEDETSKLGDNIDLHFLQPIKKNDFFEDHVVLNTANYDKYITSQDSGATWNIHSIPKWLQERHDTLFHPQVPNVVLALRHSDGALFISKDFYQTWSQEPVAMDVMSVGFGIENFHDEKTLFYSAGKNNGVFSLDFDLYVTKDLFASSHLIQENVFEFALVDNTLFVSKYKDQSLLLLVSQNEGTTWNQAFFPANSSSEFKKEGTQRTSNTSIENGYQILDSAEGTVFINVDNSASQHSKDSALLKTGNLYTSDASATSYVLSLTDNLYLNNIENDFVKVKSLVGTYLTNQLVQDDSKNSEFRTLVTFDKGGQWKPILPPELDSEGNEYTENCNDEVHGCYLQLHNSISSTIANIQRIGTLENAPGLVVGHGDVGRYLSSSNVNLFISRDGGYRWKEALKGTYKFALADHGSLIIAVEDKDRQNVVYFTWNEGETWETIKIYDEPIMINQILTKPGSTSKVFNVWANDNQGKWFVISLGFEKLMGKPCEESDYVYWSPSDGRISNERCILGERRSYQRRKVNSKCLNNRKYSRKVSSTPCKCTSEDYECDVGFYKPHLDDGCVEYAQFNLEPKASPVCSPGQGTYIPKSPYRKITQDRCAGGVENEVPYDMSNSPKKCPQGSVEHRVPTSAIVIPLLISLLALGGVGAVVVVYNKRKNYWRSRYMQLATGDHEDDIDDTGLDFSDSDDEKLSDGEHDMKIQLDDLKL